MLNPAKNQSENNTTCIHVLHFGFVLVTSLNGTDPIEQPRPTNFYTVPLWALSIVAHSEESSSAMYTHCENKYIHLVSRLENKTHETLSNRTEMQVFIKNKGKNISKDYNIHSSQYGQHTFSGIYHKTCSKQSKYQPLKYKYKIIMIIGHNIWCRHTHGPLYRLDNIQSHKVNGINYHQKLNTQNHDQLLEKHHKTVWLLQM